MNQNRWKPDGDKYESIKADEQWEKAHEHDEEPACCSCHIDAPCSWCVKNLTDEE